MGRILLLLLLVCFCFGPANISVAQTRRTDPPEVLKALLALPAPTPRHGATPNTTEEMERPPEFYATKNPPPDDAPIEDLLTYWNRWVNEFGINRTDITDAVRNRLFDACLADPRLLPQFLRLLPQTDATNAKIKELYDGAQNDERFNNEWRKNIKEWLLHNSTYFLGELLTLAKKAKDEDKGGEVNRKEALTALANLDWSNAEPLLRNLLISGQPRSSALALSLFYRHAIEEKDMSGEERYRRDKEPFGSWSNHRMVWSRLSTRGVSGPHQRKGPACLRSDEPRRVERNTRELQSPVRYSLQTGREFRVRLDAAEQFEPVAFVAAHNKVLLRRSTEKPDPYSKRSIGPDKAEFFLLDASTGETRVISGEFDPLRQRGPRSLQGTEKPDEFWAAIPDEQKNKTRIGRYNTKDFSFKLVLEVPRIVFDSLKMWVDANQGKVYLVYKGQLLRLPLQAPAPAK